MKGTFAALKRHIAAQGITLTGNPVCPGCEQEIPAREWDAHKQECRQVQESKTPR